MKNMCNVVEVLMVEDNPGDVRLVKEAFIENKICNNLHVVNDGEEALTFLRQEGKYAGVPAPDIILLDLNLPKKNGIEVLKEIKNNHGFRRIPVVVLTSSKAEQDILESYNLHANCYITKPVDMDQFVKVIKYIENFWFAIVSLPPK